MMALSILLSLGLAWLGSSSRSQEEEAIPSSLLRAQHSTAELSPRNGLFDYYTTGALFSVQDVVKVCDDKRISDPSEHYDLLSSALTYQASDIRLTRHCLPNSSTPMIHKFKRRLLITALSLICNWIQGRES